MRETGKKLSEELKRNGIDAFITYNPDNTRYLTGLKAVTKHDGHAVVTADETILVTSFLNKEQAMNECKDLSIIVSDDVFDVGSSLKGKGFKKVAVEENYITVKELKNLQAKLVEAEFVDGSQLINDVKRIKTEAEIESFKKACEITDRIFEKLLEIIRPGIAETDIQETIFTWMKKYGAEAWSFQPIIASGKRSSMPHCVPASKKLAEGDFLTIDMGFRYDGCASDFTRTVVIGKATDRQRHIYDTVLKAQQRALECIKPGMTGFEADKLARDLITEAGYGEYFGHALGHGLGDGLAISNDLSDSTVLRENMIFTIEPGIYIEGYGGVRIEDTVLLGKEGCIPLFRTPKNLLEIV